MKLKSLVQDDKSLKQVIDLQCKEYHYIGPKRKKEMKTIGFIAQDVKEVIPNAVVMQKEFIPDELRLIESPKWSQEDESSKWKLTIDNLDL